MAAPPPDNPRWVDDPYAPHDTSGANLRLGSAVGQVTHDGRAYTALGAAVAVGPRIDRFTFEADYLVLELTEPGPSSLRYGRTHRLGAMARVDVVRLGPRWIGANSLLAIYGEAGAARQWYQWSRPGLREPARVVPVDATAVVGVVGFGINLDHRLEKPLGFPNRVGWQLGWQLASTAARAADPTVACLGPTCTARPSTMTTGRNTSLIVTSTIGFTW
ncbi:MAG: hypothetical protein R3B06_02040 [Kofleriaceae bacterium]